jgi:hypothetical protein
MNARERYDALLAEFKETEGRFPNGNEKSSLRAQAEGAEYRENHEAKDPGDEKKPPARSFWASVGLDGLLG